MPTVDLATLVAREELVWQALRVGDPAADRSLLAERLLGVYPSGFADRAAHAAQVDDGPTILDHEIFDARMLDISPSAWMLSYRAAFRRPTGDAEWEEMYVSSLWVDDDGELVNVFSQDTPVSQPGSDPS